MSKIVACYSFYNEIEFIEESLRSVIDFVDYLVMVDGAYDDWPDKQDYSYDGTKDMIKQLIGNKGLIIEPPHRLMQSEKRNIYLRCVEERFNGAWMFVIDGDEVLRDPKEDFEWLHSQTDVTHSMGRLRVRNDYETEERVKVVTRLYRGIPGLHYARNHLELCDGVGDNVVDKYPSVTLDRAWIEHKRFARNSNRKNVRDFYYSKRHLPRWL